jgi:hypothetical protein
LDLHGKQSWRQLHLRLSNEDVGSLYRGETRAIRACLALDAYVRVNDADDAARRATSLDGKLIVRPRHCQASRG